MNRTLLGRASAALVLGLVALAEGTGAQPQSQPPPTTGQQPTFSVNVDLVTLDVIPRDGRGQFVPDLDPTDFRVFEDGVQQEIASMVLVHGGRVFNTLEAPSPSEAVPEGIILPRSRPRSDESGRVFVLIVDDLHFTALETPLVRQLLKKVVKTLFHPGDMVAMFSTGPSSIEIPVSSDLDLVESAIANVGGRGMTYRDIMDSKDGSMGPQGLRYNAHVAFRTAYNLIDSLGKARNRRKALILVSNGYDFDPFPAGRTGTDQVFGGRYGTPWVNPDNGDRFLQLEQANNRFADADLASELAAVTGAANRVNASIYALDPRGVVGTTSLGDQIDMTEMRAHIAKTQASLQTLAEATGGIAVINDNDYEKALKRIDAETSDYYILGYYSNNPDSTQRNRSIEVKTSRANVDVWSRGWYRTRANQAPSPKH
ncbi:MAG: VWA domain-containing protein [Acidobacteriota bacterium]|nr:VWA domain-containing protein [Acidobacteriota bacterium]